MGSRGSRTKLKQIQNVRGLTLKLKDSWMDNTNILPQFIQAGDGLLGEDLLQHGLGPGEDVEAPEQEVGARQQGVHQPLGEAHPLRVAWK